MGRQADREEVGAEDQARVVELRCRLDAKTAAKPAVSRRATGISPSSSRLRADLKAAPGPAGFPRAASGRRLRAQLVAGHASRRLPAATASGIGLDVALAVELDPERQVVGKAAVEGDPAGVVGAQEPDLAQAVGGSEDDRRPRPGGAASTLATRLGASARLAVASSSRRLRGGRGGGAAAHLGRGQAGLLGRVADQGRALGGVGVGVGVGEARRRGVLEPEDDAR